MFLEILKENEIKEESLSSSLKNMIDLKNKLIEREREVEKLLEQKEADQKLLSELVEKWK